MRVVLAPMEGVVDHAMRELLTGLGGIDRCVTEFLRVSERLLPPRVFYRLCPELLTDGATVHGVPVYLQLLGGQPTVVAENAARAAELGAPGIDLNFGCPAKTVNRSDGGAILLREPDRVHNIIAAVRNAVPADIPVTAKIRLGFADDSRFMDIVHGVQAANATELTIHARTKKHGYRPPAYWEHIALARQAVDLPIIANGEIWNTADARRARQVTHCDDLMLGRGALCRPDLPRLIAADAAGQPIDPLSWKDIPPLLLRFFDLNMASYDKHHAGNPLKQWLVYLRSYYPQGYLLFDQVKRLRDPQEIRALLEQAIVNHGDRRTAA